VVYKARPGKYKARPGKVGGGGGDVYYKSPCGVVLRSRKELLRFYLMERRKRDKTKLPTTRVGGEEADGEEASGEEADQGKGEVMATPSKQVVLCQPVGAVHSVTPAPAKGKGKKRGLGKAPKEAEGAKEGGLRKLFVMTSISGRDVQCSKYTCSAPIAEGTQRFVNVYATTSSYRCMKCIPLEEAGRLLSTKFSGTNFATLPQDQQAQARAAVERRVGGAPETEDGKRGGPEIGSEPSAKKARVYERHAYKDGAKEGTEDTKGAKGTKGTKGKSTAYGYYPCMVKRCQFTAHDEETMLEHVDLMHGGNATGERLTCTEEKCGFVSWKPQNMALHMSLVHDATKFTCQFQGCYHTEPTEMRLEEHMAAVHDNVGYYGGGGGGEGDGGSRNGGVK
jgi:hypothetical protein